MRGLKVTGKKAVLVARGFSAFENNVDVIKTAEELKAELKHYILMSLYEQMIKI